MEYEVILFDADGTLFDYERAEAYAFKEALSIHLGEYREEHLKEYRSINRAIWNAFEKGAIKAEAINGLRFQRFFQRIQVEQDPLLFSKTYIYYLSQADFLLEGALALLSSLGDYRLVLITNGLSLVQHSRLEKASLKGFFGSIIISEEVGVAKPHEEIFVKALESVDHRDKDSVIIVGDSLTSDIRGGEEFGIHTCWFNPLNEENTTPWQPTYEIQRLEMLSDVLMSKKGRISF